MVGYTGGNYVINIFDASTGQLLKACASGTSNAASFVLKEEQHTFVAVVSQLTNGLPIPDVQAKSNALVEWSGATGTVGPEYDVSPSAYIKHGRRDGDELPAASLVEHSQLAHLRARLGNPRSR